MIEPRETERDPCRRGDRGLPSLPEQSHRTSSHSFRRRRLQRFELEWIELVGGTRSEMQTPLWDGLASFVEELEPGATLAPFACPGFTDSHFLREAFGTIAYGFFPVKAMDAVEATKLVHSANERVPVDDLEAGVHMLRHVARSLLG
jgi:acetylornithine deacetylase/succinyl-diaminopimelate desuccinylase-like protein